MNVHPLALLFSWLCMLGVAAQQPVPQVSPTPSKLQEPHAADFDSPAAVVDALYATISGAASEKRDWARLRSLFAADGRMVAMVKAKTGGMRPVLLTVDDYVQRAGASLERDGFFEQEVARQTQLFGDIAHVFSTYECRHARDDAQPFLRGINSIQLVRSGERWVVLQILWEQESDAGPIPQQFLVAQRDAKAAAAELPELEVELWGSDLLLQVAADWRAACARELRLKVNVTGGGTGLGLAAVAAGDAQLALASRRIRDDELAKARAAGHEPLEVCFGQREAGDRQMLYVYYRDEPSGRIKQFVRWLSSDAGKALLQQQGIVPAR